MCVYYILPINIQIPGVEVPLKVLFNKTTANTNRKLPKAGSTVSNCRISISLEHTMAPLIENLRSRPTVNATGHKRTKALLSR